MAKRPYGDGSIFQSKSGKWVASLSYTDPATGRRMKRRRHAGTKTEAKQKMKEMKDEFQTMGAVEVSNRRVSEALGEYLRFRHLNPELSQGTHDNDKWLSGVVQDVLGNKKTAELAVSDCERLLQQAAVGVRRPVGSHRRPIMPVRIRRLRNLLVSVLDNEMRLGYLRQNVARLSLAPGRSSKAKRKRKSMELKDFELLLVGASDSLELLIEFVGRYGMRPAEARALQWGSIDFATQVATLNVEMDKNNVRGPSKTSKARRKIRLVDDTMERLASWRTRQDEQKAELFGYWDDDTAVPTTSAGKPLDRRQFNDGCKAICAEVGIGLISPYDLRTTAMSYQAKRGHTAWEIADWSGTSEKMVSDVYREELDDVSGLDPI